jgi:Xaa-Pro aminopeptidase
VKAGPEEKVMSRALTPNILTAQDLEPQWKWENRLPAWGHTSVDFERRIDHDRLRRYRLSRTRQALKNSECRALLLFDVNNIRYVSATKIGEWERDKMCRLCLLAGDDSPYVWDFGSAVVHHKQILGLARSRNIAGPASSACAARSRRISD